MGPTNESTSTYRPIPPRALLLSLAALAVPVAAAFYDFESAVQYEVLLWLNTLIPALLFAYYRGWQGATLAIALGMVVLVAIQLALIVNGETVQDWRMLLAVVVADIGLATGIGIVTELLHRDRTRSE